MRCDKYSKIIYGVLLGIISVATLPFASSIPTTLSPITKASVSKTSIFQVDGAQNTDKKASNDILFGGQQNSRSLIRDGSLTQEKTELEPHETPNNKQNESSLLNINNGSNKDFTTSSINNNNNYSPEEQLTALSGDENNTPSVDSLIRNNANSTDSVDSTSLPFLSSTDSMNQLSNNNNLNKINLEKSPFQAMFPSLPVFTYNKEQQTQLQAPNQYNRGAQTRYEANRYKRSHYHNSNSLHSNLDDLLNIKRQRRALRFKRNTNYEDFLASLLAAEEAKYNDNYNTYPSLSTNEVNLAENPQTLYYLLSHLNQEDDNYVDLDKLSKYNYENVLPLLEIDSESDSASNEDSVSEDLPVIIEPYSQQVIPVLPYPLPNRYQRIRRSYYKKYENPLSLSAYTGLRKKRNRNNNFSYDSNRGEWGKIIGAKDERSTYEDDAEEANKIYSLASLLAIGQTPQEYSQRYKRSMKPVMNIM